MSNKTVYLAKSMRENPDEPVFTSRIGETSRAAKEAVKESTLEECPVTIYNLNWEDEHVVKDGWKFVVVEKQLYEET